jgi:hypothetical protein
MRNLDVAGQTTPGHRAAPIRAESAWQTTIVSNSIQDPVSGPTRCYKKRRIAAKTLHLEKTAENVPDRMSQWVSRIIEATAIEPPIAALVRESPSDGSKGRLRVSTPGLATFCLNKSPGDVRVVCFLAAARERRRITAPATICVLRLY